MLTRSQWCPWAFINHYGQTLSFLQQPACRSYDYPHFTGEKNKASRSHGTMPKETHSWVVLVRMFCQAQVLSLKMLMSHRKWKVCPV